MKKLLILSTLFIFAGCGNILFPEYREYTVREPIYESNEAYLAKIGHKDTLEMDSIGRIYHYGRFQILNEVNRGIHILDISNPADPQYLVFYEIPGNRDVAVKEDVLYADSYSNLLAFDFSKPLEIRLLKTIPNAFAAVFQNGYPMLDPDKGHVRDWQERTVREKVNKSSIWGPTVMEDGMAGSSTNTESAGKAGSLSRFAMGGEYLYSVNDEQLYSFDIRTPADPKIWAQSYVGWGLETLFKKDNRLFIGAMSAMYIYDISEGSNPVFLSEFSHATSCDPVVVEGNYAYVTLRAMSNCRMGNNELNVIDLTDIKNPALVKTYAMHNPHGLAVQDSILYVCEGNAGVKIFDASNPGNLKVIAYISDIEAIDIILNGESASVISSSGVYQYDVRNPENPVRVSYLEVAKT